MKKTIALLIAAVMLLTMLAGCTAPNPAAAPSAQNAPASVTPATGTPAAVTFTDSAGRKVEVPSNITKVAISGPLAQIAIFALAPDKLVGIATPWDKAAEEFLNTEYYNLPVLGQLYGGKGELNLETLLASGAQVVIDVGEPKQSIVEDMDDLQKQTGIPFVHITATTGSMGDAYRMLGKLLNMGDQAETLAKYCDQTYKRTQDIANSVSKANLLYCSGDKGINVIAKGSYHSEIIDLLSNNLAVVDNPSSKGTGNEVDMEQILKWNPDVILFAPGSIYSTVGTDPAWQKVTAIKEGRYYEVPNVPYNWMGFPPSVQRYLGMMWMAQLLYPETAKYDLYKEVENYYKLFYHCDISKEQYQKLVANSIDKK